MRFFDDLPYPDKKPIHNIEDDNFFKNLKYKAK